MNDLFEIVEDLKDIDTFGSDTTAFEDILVKWEARLIDAQDEAERQYELFDGLEAQQDNTPLAQRLEQSAHNALVTGSNPVGSTNARMVEWQTLQT